MAAVAASLTVALLWSIAAPPAVYAHAGNRVELYVHDLAVRPSGPGEWVVHADIVDADSGRPAPGFDVVASGTAGSARFGPVTLDDPANTGRYEAVVSGPSGPWAVTLEARARPGGEAAVPFTRTWNIVVAEAGMTQPALARAPTGTGAPAIEVRIERGSEKGPNEFYVPILVTVLDTPTGRPSAAPFDVFATARNRAGETTEAFPFIELPQDGRHSGFVIVPHGGPWTVTAVVNGRRDERNPKPPVTYGRASLDFDVTAGSLGSTRDPAGGQPPRGVNFADLTVMWLHVLFGLGWLVTAGLLGAVSLPAGRRLLSEQARNMLDQRLAGISRSAVWLAGLVIFTGVFHLGRSVPYRVPMSITAAQRLFRLPYAEPYFAALAVKLAAFAATVPLVISLAVRARKLAAMAVPAFPADDRTGRIASPLRGSLPVVVLTTAAATITIAVTVLKYLHILSEAARAVVR
jgi:hypothetical protein